ncbi:MAG: CAP domain-containing protein [bacterium]
MKSVLFTLLFALFAHAAVASEELQELNKIRGSLGLTPWASHSALEVAAQNHADYLHQNRTRGHAEQRGKPAFTGESHVDRTVHTGYPSRHTGENASFHTYSAGVKESIDGLMAAIYHRFAFLSLDHDEIGIGVTRDDQYTTFVYDFGTRRKRELCEGPAPLGAGKRYTLVCLDARQPVDARAFEQAIHETRIANPAIITFPTDGDEDIPPAFYEEAPDPLPNHDVSGFPVSVQFNPATFSRPPTITGWSIYREGVSTPLETIVYMRQQNDPHRKLTAHEHVLFPSERLEWNTHYQIVLNYEHQGKPEQLSWGFKTRDPGLPLYTIETSDRYIQATAGDRFVIYAPPRHSRDQKNGYQSKFRQRPNVKIDFIDDHTLDVTALDFPGTTWVQFQGREFRIDVRL